jgi:hypothetical protein
MTKTIPEQPQKRKKVHAMGRHSHYGVYPSPSGAEALGKNNMTLMRKSITEHQDYLYGIVKLKLFFIWRWKAEHPGEPVRDILRNRVDIYRKTSVNTGLLNPTEIRFDSPEWLALEAKMEAAYREFQDDAASFERCGFEIFKGVVDERLEKDFNDRSGLAGYQCGSLRFDEQEGKTDIPLIGFHIANAVAPASIFDDPDYLPRCFMDLMDKTERKYHSTRLGTTTWLNSVPRWLELFPREWIDNLGPEGKDVQWHYGFWGQFITSRGTLNHKATAHLRRTGELLFYPRKSNCSFAAMRAKCADGRRRQ